MCDGAERTRIEPRSDHDFVEVEGVEEKTVSVDYFLDQPRLIVYADDHPEGRPSHVIYLPTEGSDE